MSNVDTEVSSRTSWYTMPFEGTTSLFRQFKTRNLQGAENIAEQALHLIADSGHDESSIISYNSECCTISLHVAVEGEITQGYYDLTDKIDKVVRHA
ncbi:MAG TPA: hypothetical protein VFT16_00580 [Candidatus Saccharimonadales bacterium]|nr:hypothetical protein [Candidatus Saccharimonadales bacterium]